MKTRIVAWAAGFGMALLSYWYFPSWKECAVFLLFYIMSVLANTANGIHMFANHLMRELESEK